MSNVHTFKTNQRTGWFKHNKMYNKTISRPLRRLLIFWHAINQRSIWGRLYWTEWRNLLVFDNGSCNKNETCSHTHFKSLTYGLPQSFLEEHSPNFRDKYVIMDQRGGLYVRETCDSSTSSRDIKAAGLNLGTLSKIESSSAMICLHALH